MPGVNPQILVWARETAALTQEHAAKKLGFRDGHGLSATEKLAAVEGGVRDPSRPQLVKMADQYRRPLLTFYLSKPPKKGRVGTDFRTNPEGHLASEEALLSALIRDIIARQSMVRASLEDEDEAETLPFIGSHSIGDGRAVVLGSLQTLLGVDSAAYRAQPGTSAAFDLLRTRVEELGAFVLLKGDLGNYLSAIDTTVFRGLSIADDVAPFVVINDQDARSAWSFTLLHETVHLLLGQTGISGEDTGSEIEQFCDDVAGEFLLPASELDRLSIHDSAHVDDIIRQIGAFADGANVSRAMVAYRAYRALLISQKTYHQLREIFRREWHESRERARAQGREQERGPNYYTVRRHRLGKRIVNLVERMMTIDAVSTSKAARILGVKPRQVQPLFSIGRQAWR